MFYGYREGPGWYQGAPRPPRGTQGGGVVFGLLMVNTLGRCGMRRVGESAKGAQSHAEAKGEGRKQNVEVP